ncbi:hypothetical protein L218DRAFT_874147 [Marasmius fiardii PR-910]|nr:hypothetical protein L218DRAFT_874147 [Marasmius fiardii PR-910]
MKFCTAVLLFTVRVAIPESVLALIPASQCTTLLIQCCRSLITADNSSVAPVIALLGIPVTPDCCDTMYSNQ